MTKQTKRTDASSARQTRVLATFGLAFVLGSFALLLYHAFTQRTHTADVTVRVDEITQSSDAYRVTVVIENRGDATAAGLVIEGVLTKDGKELETSLLTVDYVPAGSRRDATLFFSSDPRAAALTVRPKGYIEP